MEKVLNDVEPDTAVRSDGVRKGTSSFAGGVLALSGGAAAAQAVAILAAPIISRLFAPEAFGLAALFASSVAIFTTVSCLKYELAIMLPKKESDAATLFGLCCVLTISSSLVALVLVACCGRWLLARFNASELEPYVWLFPLGVFLFGIGLPLMYWHSRHRRFVHLGATKGISTTSTIAVTMGSGAVGYASGGHLIVARLLMPLCTAVMLSWYMLRHDLPFVSRHVKAGDMWRMSKRYRKFPIFGSWSSLLNAGSQQIPVIMLAAFFGTSVAGLYWRATSLFAIPLLLFGQSLTRVFFQRAAEEHCRGGNISDLVEGLCQRMMALTMLPLFIVALMGRDIFIVILGAQWAEAGVYAAVLVPWMLACFLASCVTSLFDVLELQEKDLVFNFLFLSIKVGSLALGGLLLENATFSLLILSIACMLAYTFRACFILSKAGASPRRLVLSLKAYFIVASAALAIIAIARWWIKPPSVWLLLVATLISVLYYVYLLRRDRYLRQVLLQIVRKLVTPKTDSTNRLCQ